MSILLVALGSGIGGACRYLVGLVLPMVGGFPWATLCVNVLGSFLIGAFGSLGARLGWSDGVRLFLTVGLQWGLTP